MTDPRPDEGPDPEALLVEVILAATDPRPPVAPIRLSRHRARYIARHLLDNADAVLALLPSPPAPAPGGGDTDLRAEVERLCDEAGGSPGTQHGLVSVRDLRAALAARPDADRDALTRVHAATVADGVWCPPCDPSLRWTVPLILERQELAQVTCEPCRAALSRDTEADQ